MSQVRVKICGITNGKDALAAANAGADAIGLNFHPASPRCVSLPTAAVILERLPAFVSPVGVFVGQTLPEACGIAESIGLRIIQRHGDEHEPADLPRFHLIEVFRVADRGDIPLIVAYLAAARSQDRLPCTILIDAKVPGEYGGTGRMPPWDIVAELPTQGVPLILAGGLTPDNVAEAVRIVRPYAVDVASGVESSPGKKDADKIKRFIDNARSAR